MGITIAKGLSLSLYLLSAATIGYGFVLRFFVGRSGLSISMVIYEIRAEIRERKTIYISNGQLEMYFANTLGIYLHAIDGLI